MMPDRIDARGLSCPQPVVMTRNKMDTSKSCSFEVLVDSGAARDNICRMATGMGWDVQVTEDADECILVLSKK